MVYTLKSLAYVQEIHCHDLPIIDSTIHCLGHFKYCLLCGPIRKEAILLFRQYRVL